MIWGPAVGLATFASASLAFGFADAQTLAYPTSNMLLDTRSDSALYVECEPPSGTRMQCAFTEIRVQPGPDAPVPLTSLPEESDCAGLPALAAALTEGVPLPGGDAEVFRERFARQPAAQKADIAALVGAFTDYCAKKDGSAEKLAEAMRDKTRRSCTLNIATYRLDFDWSAGAGRWETLSALGSDDCETVTVAGFERPTGSGANARWNYRVASRATRTEAAGAACSATPATEHLYAAEPADVYAHCDYLLFQD